MSNLPPGTWEGDPFAPWNEPEAMWCAAGEDCENTVAQEGDFCEDCEGSQ